MKTKILLMKTLLLIIALLLTSYIVTFNCARQKIDKQQQTEYVLALDNYFNK